MKTRMLKTIVISLTAAMVLSMAGCSKTETSSEKTLEETTEELNGIPNPMEEVEYSKICEVTGCDAILSDRMENPKFYLIDGELGEIDYTIENGSTSMTLRTQKTDEFTDISGMYYDWTFNEDGNVWDYESKEMGTSDSEGDVRVILWYNQYSGVMYSLSASAKDLNGYDIQADAMSFMMPEEPLDNYPANDLETRCGKTEFDSYDEIVSLLEGEEAYALVNIKGYDGDVLLVASGVYDNLDGENMASIEATPYTLKSNGKVTADSILYSGGTAYPISIDDNGLVYCFGNHSIEESCYGENGTDNVAIMIMKTISVLEFDNDGNPTKISGFYREPSSTSVMDESTDYAEDDIDAYYKSYDDLGASHIVNFTTLDGRTAQKL